MALEKKPFVIRWSCLEDKDENWSLPIFYFFFLNKCILNVQSETDSAHKSKSSGSSLSLREIRNGITEWISSPIDFLGLSAS